MRRTLITPNPTVARVNITPVIGLALVLVLILLITGPMFSVADVAVELPKASTRGPEDDRRITVTVGAEGELAVDEHRVTREELRGMMLETLADPEREKALVVVRADEGVRHQVVRDIVAEVASAGAARIAIGTRQRTGVAS
jgi:biopolymer transport protein ExbD